MAHRRFISAVGSGLLVLLLCGTAFAAGPYAYITRSFTDKVDVIDTASAGVVATITVGAEPVGVAVTPSRAYVANLSSNTVSVIDTARNEVVATIPVGQGPYGVATDAAFQRVWVTNQFDHTVSVIDTATNAVVHSVPVGSRPVGIAVHPSGSRVFVLSGNTGTLEVIEMTSAGVPNVVTSLFIGSGLEALALSPDGTRAWIPNGMNGGSRLTVVDASDWSVKHIPLTTTPRGVAVDHQGRRVYVVHLMADLVSVVDTQLLAVVQTMSGVGSFAFGVTVHPSAPQLWVANENSSKVVALDTNTAAVSAVVTVPDGPAAFGSFIAAPGQAGCDDGLQAAVEQSLARVERVMRRSFYADFKVPGDTTGARVRRVGVGVRTLSRGHLTGVYHSLVQYEPAAGPADPTLCDAALKAAVEDTLTSVETAVRVIDPGFRLPGNGLVSRLDHLANAVERLDRGRLQGLYWTLR